MKKKDLPEHLQKLLASREEAPEPLTDEEMCESLEEHSDEDSVGGESDEILEDDPWEQQKQFQKKKSSDKYAIW